MCIAGGGGGRNIAMRAFVVAPASGEKWYAAAYENLSVAEWCGEGRIKLIFKNKESMANKVSMTILHAILVY